MIAAGVMLGTVMSYGQNISSAQVSSVVLNNFKTEFPKASDVEWEQKDTVYEVDFEIALTDHEAWFDSAGKLIKHTENLKVRDLPQAIQNSIKQGYKEHRVKDAKKITGGSEIKYELELEKGEAEWKIMFNTAGTELSKRAD